MCEIADTEPIMKNQMRRYMPYLELGHALRTGKMGLKVDYNGAEKAYQIAAERGSSLAQHKLGYSADEQADALEGEGDTKAEIMKRSTAKHDQKFILAKKLATDLRTKAKHYYKLAAAQGNGDALNNYATLVEREYEEKLDVDFLETDSKEWREVNAILKKGALSDSSAFAVSSYAKSLSEINSEHGFQMWWDGIAMDADGETGNCQAISGMLHMMGKDKEKYK